MVKRSLLWLSVSVILVFSNFLLIGKRNCVGLLRRTGENKTISYRKVIETFWCAFAAAVVACLSLPAIFLFVGVGALFTWYSFFSPFLVAKRKNYVCAFNPIIGLKLKQTPYNFIFIRYLWLWRQWLWSVDVINGSICFFFHFWWVFFLDYTLTETYSFL